VRTIPLKSGHIVFKDVDNNGIWYIVSIPLKSGHIVLGD